MSPLDCLPYPDGIWLVDTEYRKPDGHPLPTPWCVVAREARTGRTYRWWYEDLGCLGAPQFPTGKDALFVCHNAEAELGVFAALGWEMPFNIYDTYAEFRCYTNRVKVPGMPPVRAALVQMLRYLGLHHLAGADKPEMQQLAMRGAPFTNEERLDLLRYCEQDVLALQEALPLLLERLWKRHPDKRVYLGQALYRGNYMRALAEVGRNGVPLDAPLLRKTLEHWSDIKLELIRRTDADFGFFEGTTFKQDRFVSYLKRTDILWPSTATGRPAMDEDTWKQQALLHPQLQPMRELISTLDKMKLNKLAIGPDDRNRCWLGPFTAATSRNQPSSAQFIFGPATWVRSFVKPPEGYALVYADWSAQEIAVAAVLARDSLMQEDYTSGDPYLTFGKRIGYLPESATKRTHGPRRDALKSILLGINYGRGRETTASQLGMLSCEVREILRNHKLRYSRFWGWIDNEIAYGYALGHMRTRLGWNMRVLEGCRPTSLMNFHMQAHGAEMLRIGIVKATQAGLRIAAPVHDAVLMESPLADLGDHIETLKHCMTEASRIVLDGFEVRVDADAVQYPDRYVDGRGKATWDLIQSIQEGKDTKRAGVVELARAIF